MTDTAAPDTLPALIARRDALLQTRADLARRMHEVTMALGTIRTEIWRLTRQPERLTAADVDWQQAYLDEINRGA